MRWTSGLGDVAGASVETRGEMLMVVSATAHCGPVLLQPPRVLLAQPLAGHRLVL